MKRQLLILAGLFIICIGYGQQSNFGKVPLTKIEKTQQKSSPEGVLFSKLKAASGTEFRNIQTITDKLKMNHITYQQYHNGIKVEYGTIKLHERNGVKESYNGAYFDISNVVTAPSISINQVITTAKQYFGTSDVFWLNGEEISKTNIPTPELVILPNRKTETLQLAYAIGAGSSSSELKMGILYIDAQNGSVLKFKNLVFGCFDNKENKKDEGVYSKNVYNAAFVSGTGTTVYSGSQSIETTLESSEHILYDQSRANTGSSHNAGISTKNGIATVNINHSSSLTDYNNSGVVTEFTDTDNTWTAAEMSSDEDQYTLDAHWGAQVVYDYFSSEHGKNSYDGNDSAIVSYVHYGTDYTNAAWVSFTNNRGFMIYGDGGGSYTPLTTLDVAAHEIAHGITNNTADLDYELESGALNEGFSDIWAMVIENHANNNLGTSKDFSEINEENGGGAFRSMSNPNAYGQPDTYGGTNWIDTSSCTPDGDAASPTYNDYCGVHTNSGVLNYWFWLLSQGGSGTNDNGDSFTVTSIGMDDAAAVAYRMQNSYLTSTSDYDAARTVGIQSAQDLFGACSSQEEAVTNAFYAVGVGVVYETILPSIDTDPTDTSVAETTTASFFVDGDDYDSIQWQEKISSSWEDITDNTTYTGSTSTTLSIANTSVSMDGYTYRAVFTNSCGSTNSTTVTLSVTAYTQIPDANFEAKLESLGYDDISNDGQVPTELIEGVTSLDIRNSSITDLTGIEDFTALVTLLCRASGIETIDVSQNLLLETLTANNNSISTIDLSNNTVLKSVNLGANSLTTLDVSNNTALTSLSIQSSGGLTTIDVSNNTLLKELKTYNSNIATLDISNNTALQTLQVYGSPIATIDVTNNPDLKDLRVHSTNIITLDLSNNPDIEQLRVNETNIESLDVSNLVALQRLYANDMSLLSSLNVQNGNNGNITVFRLTDNPSLACIRVDDIAYSTTNWTEIDAGLNFSDTYCRYTAIPDANFEAWLDGQGYDDISSDGQVPTALIEVVTSVTAQFEDITDFTGVEDFVALESLSVSYNSFTSLDVSNNTNLTFLNCGYSTLTDLDVSNNLLLETLWVNSTNLSALDLSLNTNLTSLTASAISNLTTLNMQNGNNTNVTNFTTGGNSNLACVLVDDAAYSTTNWTDIESGTSFSDTYCRYTAISDANFEAALEALGYDDISSDGQVPTALIEVVTTLHVSSKNISNLKGIEDFVALEDLNVQDNSLSSLDLSNNVLLEDLNCAFNKFFYLDVSANTVLNSLYANNGWLLELDVSANTQLQYLYVVDNYLTSLNYQNGNNTNNLFFNATGNSNLTCLLVDDVAYSTTNWTDIDAQTNFSDTYCDYTAIPDANFETALDALGYDDISSDGQVPTALIEVITALDISNENIEDLTGINDFEALTALDCSNNELASVSLNSTSELTYLNISNNNLTTLEAPTSIINLIANSNDLVYLDLVDHTVLEELSVNSNNLIYLNLQNGANTNIYNLITTGNTDLTCIIVDDVTYSTNNLSNNIDATTTSFSDTYCKYTQIPDANFEARLESLGHDDITGDGQVPTGLIIDEEHLDISFANSAAIYDVTGIEDFYSLVNLILDDNVMTSIDVSSNLSLSYLTANNTALTTLDLSVNTLLEYIILNDNTDLAVVNIQNGTNTNLDYSSDFQATNTPNLTCVLVDDATYSTTTWTYAIDPQIIFNQVSCIDYTSIPDVNFEAALEVLGYDDITSDGQVPTALIEGLTSLDVSSSSIANLTGIEDFIALTDLKASDNALISVDVSANTMLTSLSLHSNSLTSIDVTNNTLLTSLSVSFNELTAIDITNNVLLESFYCNSNDITAIDVSLNTNIKFANFSDNLFTQLDFSGNSLLSFSSFNNNNLESLNLQNGTNESLFLHVSASGNPNLTCVLVDNVTYSTSNWTDIDVQTSFSDTSCDSVVIAAKVFLQGAMLNPNTGEESWMRDDLRAQGGLYGSNSPYGDGAEITESIGLSDAGSNSTVDWIWVELRDSTDPTIIIAGKSAILQRDGDVVDVADDRVTPLTFEGIASGSYYVVIKHRNHLGIMTATAISLSDTETTIDFTDGSIATYGTNAQTTYGMPSGVSAMWAGDANGDGVINLIGGTNDTNTIRDTILNDPINLAIQFYGFNVTGYNDSDVNLSTGAQIIGSNNDANLVRDNILNHPINTFIQFYGFNITEQLPEAVSTKRIALDIALLQKMNALAAKNTK